MSGSGTRGTVEPALRFADEYNTPFASPEAAAAIRARVPGLRFSVMTGCIVGETRDDALERAHALYSRVPREPSFDEWLAAYGQRAVIGSVDEVLVRLREYEAAGADRVILQHLLHADLEPVRLIGELGQQLV